MTNDADFIKDFIMEGNENLDRIEALLLPLEKNPAATGSLAEIFRGFHTIKGTSRMFEFRHVEKLAHNAEDLLSRIRDGHGTLTREMVSGLLRVVETLRQLFTVIEVKGDEGSVKEDPLVEPLSSAAAQAEPVQEVRPAPPSPSGLSENTLRVSVPLLDRLMAEVGELVLTRNRILKWANGAHDQEAVLRSQRLNMITTEIQRQVMQLRLQPVGHLWNKIPRLVRDLCGHLGKQAHLSMEGAETELDKSLLEAIRDPLTHLVRNALDHGIESPDRRRKAGKDPEGIISLRAKHESGWVLMEISDDGSGIDPSVVRQRAVEKGYMSSADVGRLSDQEVLALLFQPGFSTASSVTEVSGRGVGLDVVKDNIEKAGGSVEVETVPHQGTCFRLRVPLTLSIVPSLVVADENQEYAIPQVHVVEMIRLRGERAARVEWVEGAAVFRLRGKLLPLVFLHQALRGEAPPREVGPWTLVVLQAGDHPFGLVVERVKDTEEIVVKPLGRHMKGLSLYEGATIMGDGRVALILDAMGLAQSAHVISALEKTRLTKSSPDPAPAPEKKEALLIVVGPDDSRAAVPLSRVDRLEEFPAASVERVGDQELIQYRGQLLPLHRLSSLLPNRRRKPRGDPVNSSGERMPVVVCRTASRLQGLVVHRILDMMEASLTAPGEGARRGVTGTVIANGRIAEVLDLDGLFHGPVRSPGGRA